MSVHSLYIRPQQYIYPNSLHLGKYVTLCRIRISAINLPYCTIYITYHTIYILYYGDCARWSYISDIDFGQKWCHFRKRFQAKGSSVAHSP